MDVQIETWMLVVGAVILTATGLGFGIKHFVQKARRNSIAKKKELESEFVDDDWRAVYISCRDGMYSAKAYLLDAIEGDFSTSLTRRGLNLLVSTVDWSHRDEVATKLCQFLDATHEKAVDCEPDLSVFGDCDYWRGVYKDVFGLECDVVREYLRQILAEDRMPKTLTVQGMEAILEECYEDDERKDFSSRSSFVRSLGKYLVSPVMPEKRCEKCGNYYGEHPSCGFCDAREAAQMAKRQKENDEIPF